MRAVVQRVRSARVTVDAGLSRSIGRGLVVLVGVAAEDREADADRLAAKIARLRIFAGETGKFDRSVLDVAGSALVVSQFTLIADSRKGTRPDFSGAAPRDVAEPLYSRICDALQTAGVPVQRGVFGASMQVELVNDGPVTIVLDT